MLIDDKAALQEWLVATLEPLCDAEPTALARYVLALVTKDKPLDRLRENCIDRLDVFLDRATKDFVDQLFDVIRTRRYIPEAKKENVEPKASDSGDEKSGETVETVETQESTSSDRQETESQVQNTTSIDPSSSSSEPITTVQHHPPGAIIQPVKRRYPHRSSSGRNQSPNPRRHVNTSTGGANRYQNSSYHRPSTMSNPSNQRTHRSSSRSRSVSPPPAKRSQRSYSHSSSGSSSRSSPSRQSSSIHPTSSKNTDFLYNKNPCSDFFDNKPYRALGDSGSYDDGNNPVVFDQTQQPLYYQHYPPYGLPPPHLHPHYHEYNPENPELKRGPHPPPPMFLSHPPPLHHHPRMHGPPMGNVPPNQQSVGQPPLLMNPQRNLVTVVTNAEPLPLELRMRQNEQMAVPNNLNVPISHQKRHGHNVPYSNDRRSQQHESSTNHEPQSNQSSNNHNHNNNHHNSNNGSNNRGWKRPWQKHDGSGTSSNNTLEIRKIPVEFNTISKLNEHFSKFGNVTNVQIAYDGSPDSALVAYGTYSEADTAYKNPQPLFNNRFIKIFWHNNNKNQNTSHNNNNNNNQSNQTQTSEKNSQASSSQISSSETSISKRLSGPTTNPKKEHWIKAQQQSNSRGNAITTTVSTPTTVTSTTARTSTTSSETPSSATSTTPSTNTTTVSAPNPTAAFTKKSPLLSANLTKKEAAKKAALEIHRKKQDLLDAQIQRQKLLLKKFEAAETAAEKDSIRSLMKQVDAAIIALKDSLRLTTPTQSTVASSTVNAKKMSQQDVLKQRAESLKKQIETLKANASAVMLCGITGSLGQSSFRLSDSSVNNESVSKENKDDSIETDKTHSHQLIIRNIKDLSRADLEEFLKKYGAKSIETAETTENELLVTMNSLSDIDKIKKEGLQFGDHQLDVSFKEESSLNMSGKKRTLSESLEEELLSSAVPLEQKKTERDHEDYEPDAKRPNQSRTSDNEENDDEDQLLANDENQTKHTTSSTHLDDEESTGLDNNELKLLGT